MGMHVEDRDGKKWNVDDETGAVISEVISSSESETDVNPDGTNKEPVENELNDDKGVSWKNRAKEFERKYQDALDKLNITPPAQPVHKVSKSSARIEAYRKSLEDKGYSKTEIQERMEPLEIIREATLEEVESKISPQLRSVASPAIKAQNREVLSELEQDAEIGADIKKYKKDILGKLEEMYQSSGTVPEMNKDQMEFFAGKVLLRKERTPKSSTPTKKLKDGENTSEEQHPSVTKVSGVSNDEINEYAIKNNFDCKTPDQRAKIAEAIKAEKKFNETLEKNSN